MVRLSIVTFLSAIVLAGQAIAIPNAETTPQYPMFGGHQVIALEIDIQTAGKLASYLEHVTPEAKPWFSDRLDIASGPTSITAKSGSGTLKVIQIQVTESTNNPLRGSEVYGRLTLSEARAFGTRMAALLDDNPDNGRFTAHARNLFMYCNQASSPDKCFFGAFTFFPATMGDFSDDANAPLGVTYVEKLAERLRNEK